MDTSTLYLVLGLLAFGVALSLRLSLAAVDAARNFAAARTLQPTPPLDEVIPAISARPLQGRAHKELSSLEMPAVLLFLSSTCPKCRQKLPEVAGYLPLLEHAGLELWLVSREPAWRLRRFLRGSPLAQHALRVGMRDYKMLNPTMGSPFYLFVDNDGKLQAGGMVGDENWQTFQQQMQEIGAQREAA
ncbi:redoxin domain-containing protein [Pseudoduganella violaceinigra]|uniref:redoxin domain-containing protein n=1 Tax=Pseudoduganella violaceinigra TaxID=246602 RepID=UPI0004004A51|nr:redoxin domain-containing protein [Pseudoduganella violaceinigra]